MRIAVPMADEALSAHFGRCETFALFDVDPVAKEIVGRTELAPPPHEHGVFPRWLREQGVALVIAGGMGSRAERLLRDLGIQVVLGAAETDPEAAVTLYLRRRLAAGANSCTH